MLNTAYNPILVALSMLIASTAAYVALDLAGRVTAASGRTRRFWILGSAAAMGIGIWSMHFVGMLALVVSAPVAYDVPLVAVSLVVAIVGSAVTFFMSARDRLRPVELVIASLFMGPAIAGMHYIGMAAMRMPARISYDAALVALSIAIAIGFSFLALQLAMRLRRDESGRGRLIRVGAAAVMGAAVYGMHYTGMVAARFEHAGAAMPESRWSVLGTDTLAAAVSLTTLMILAIAVVGAVADRRIRARVAEADELRRTTSLLRAVIEDSPEAIVVTDRDLRVARWNAAATSLFGWQESEIVGQPLDRILPPEERAAYETAQRELALLDDRASKTEATCRRKDQTTVEVSVSRAVLRDARNEPAGFVFLITDETERKRLEGQIRQSQKMDAVGQLAGGIAHDFNNLLTAITSYAGLVIQDLGPEHESRADVVEIQKAAERAGSLTKQLLAFSRQQRVQPTLLQLTNVVSEMRDMLRRLIPANIELVTRLDRAAGTIRADKGQIEQVLLNIVLNARDAMPRGGILSIETAQADVTGQQHQALPGCNVAPGRYAKLTVSDTGTGMSPEVQARMFEPFFTTKPAGAGTGLGLATVYGIVRQGGGCLAVRSEKGRGTSIDVVFPLATASGPKPTEPANNGAGGSETILLVEDQDLVRTVTRRVLEKEGYTVLEATTASEALSIHASRHDSIDLVITDIVMPGLSGYDLQARLLERDPDLRILFMSGYSREALARGATGADGDAFLAKPFTPEALTARVRQVLDS